MPSAGTHAHLPDRWQCDLCQKSVWLNQSTRNACVPRAWLSQESAILRQWQHMHGMWTTLSHSQSLMHPSGKNPDVTMSFKAAGHPCHWKWFKLWTLATVNMRLCCAKASGGPPRPFNQQCPQHLRPCLLLAVLQQRSCTIACQSAVPAMRHLSSTCRAAKLTPAAPELSKQTCWPLFYSHRKAQTGATAHTTCLDWSEKQHACTYALWL